MGNQVGNVVTTLAAIAIISVLVGPKKQTANVISAFGKALSGAFTAAGQAGN